MYEARFHRRMKLGFIEASWPENVHQRKVRVATVNITTAIPFLHRDHAFFSAQATEEPDS